MRELCFPKRDWQLANIKYLSAGKVQQKNQTPGFEKSKACSSFAIKQQILSLRSLVPAENLVMLFWSTMNPSGDGTWKWGLCYLSLLEKHWSIIPPSFPLPNKTRGWADTLRIAGVRLLTFQIRGCPSLARHPGVPAGIRSLSCWALLHPDFLLLEADSRPQKGYYCDFMGFSWGSESFSDFLMFLKRSRKTPFLICLDATTSGPFLVLVLQQCHRTCLVMNY